jgi:hypothetical protein
MHWVEQVSLYRMLFESSVWTPQNLFRSLLRVKTTVIIKMLFYLFSLFSWSHPFIALVDSLSGSQQPGTGLCSELHGRILDSGEFLEPREDETRWPKLRWVVSQFVLCSCCYAFTVCVRCVSVLLHPCGSGGGLSSIPVHCDGQSDSGTDFAQSTWFSLVGMVPQMIPFSFIHESVRLGRYNVCTCQRLWNKTPCAEVSQLLASSYPNCNIARVTLPCITLVTSATTERIAVVVQLMSCS